MVRVLGRPVIDYLKDTLVEGGINEIVLTTGYRGRQLEDHVATWSAPGLQASVNQEATPMGTAGSVGLLRDRLTSTFVVGSGDGIISFDLASLIQRHRSVGAIATMALWEVEDPSPFGIVGLGATPTSEVDGSLMRAGSVASRRSQRSVRHSPRSSTQACMCSNPRSSITSPRGCV